MDSQHVLVVPCPAQGHVTPFIKLSYNLARRGIKVTFANSEFFEAQILAAMSETDKEQCPLRLVSYSDGLKPHDDQRNGFGLIDSLKKVMPEQLEKLIKQINHSSNNEPITCVIADPSVGWTLEVAGKLGLKMVVFWPAGPDCLALLLHIPKLIKTGVIDINGSIIKNESISLSEEVLSWNTNEFTWSCPANPTVQKLLFDMCLTVKQAAENARFVLCNTYYELDSSSCDLIPNILPIGPLLTTNNLNIGTLSFQDSTCLSWLDQQPSNSVIYVAFGSTTVLSQKQFNELALGLELSGHSFLWVVRSNIMHESFPDYPNGFLERIASRGKIIEWAPQEKVLAHPCISCFFSHCGWNSTMEGLSYGVPFLCWPYFADQFRNQNDICDLWKVGLKLEYAENGIISRHEIKTKIDNLLSNDGIKSNAFKLMVDAKRIVSEGGSSNEHFESFIKYLKD